MFPAPNLLFTEKFFTTPKSVFDEVVITDPLSTPYNEENDGKDLSAFQGNPDNFNKFRDNYYKLADQLLPLADALELPNNDKQVLAECLNIFKSRLFNPSYCDAKPNVLWNFSREYLEILVVLLRRSQIPNEKRLDVIKNLSRNLTVCSEGVVSHLQEAIQNLVDDGSRDSILRTKETLVQQLVIDFVQSKHFCRAEMEVHYVNAFNNAFADTLGLNKRAYEQTVTTDNKFFKQYVNACGQTIAEKLPIALVNYLSDELYSAARQALQGGRLEGEPWQHFVDSPIAKNFTSATILNALFVEDEQIGNYKLSADSRSLHWLIARDLMDQGWLQPQEPRHLIDRDDGGALYTLADTWAYWQGKNDSAAQRPLAPEELLILGELYLKGERVGKHEKLGLQCVQNAADQGYAPAQHRLGEIYLEGQGIHENRKKALHYLQRAVQQGYAPAQCTLGEIYLKDRGSSHQHNLEALRLIKDAENQGYAPAQYRLGKLCLGGRVVGKSKEQAFQYFKASANQGYAPAQYELGMMYLSTVRQSADQDLRRFCESMLCPITLPINKSQQKAFNYFKLSAEQGHAPSQYTVGIMYLYGRGVLKDEKQALVFIKSAVRKGYSPAKVELINMYFRGVVDKEDKEAVQCLQDAAQSGDTLSKYELGKLYLNGQVLGKDNLKAFRLIKDSADNGCAPAQCKVGEMYLSGQGVDKNEQKAFNYFTLSADQGYAEAGWLLKKMENIQQPALGSQRSAALIETIASFGEPQASRQGVAAMDRDRFNALDLIILARANGARHHDR